MSSVAQIFFHASEQHQEHRFLDVIVSIDRRSKRVGQDLKCLLSLCKLLDVFDIRVRDDGLSNSITGLSCECGDIVGENNGPKRKKMQRLEFEPYQINNKSERL
jgi:hypothetical protein